jgi:hypothetical protein
MEFQSAPYLRIEDLFAGTTPKLLTDFRNWFFSSRRCVRIEETTFFAISQIELWLEDRRPILNLSSDEASMITERIQSYGECLVAFS